MTGSVLKTRPLSAATELSNSSNVSMFRTVLIKLTVAAVGD